MLTTNSPEFARNYGFWNEKEQKAIMSSRVAIAGVGGDGFQLGLKLARMGVGTFDIADPESFEPENANRVPGATIRTYGRNKAIVFREEVHKVNPKADIRIFESGVTEENIDDFLSRATIVFDESELTHLHIGTALARAARKKGIPNILVMNIGFAAQVTSFHPKAGKNGKGTFEHFMGIPKGASLEEIKKMKIKFNRCLPYFPPYIDFKTLRAVQSGAALPSIAQGVDIASAIGASQAFLHMTQGVDNNRPQPVWAPSISYMDAYNFKSGKTHFPRLSHICYLILALARYKLDTNPRASYSVTDLQKRKKNN